MYIIGYKYLNQMFYLNVLRLLQETLTKFMHNLLIQYLIVYILIY